MFVNPEVVTQLAREHQRQLQADASQRHQHARPAPSIPGTATRIFQRLATAIARAGAVAAEAPGAIWPARPHLAEPATPASTPDRRH